MTETLQILETQQPDLDAERDAFLTNNEHEITKSCYKEILGSSAVCLTVDNPADFTD